MRVKRVTEGEKVTLSFTCCGGNSIIDYLEREHQKRINPTSFTNSLRYLGQNSGEPLRTSLHGSSRETLHYHESYVRKVDIVVCVEYMVKSIKIGVDNIVIR